jgi:FKBP-type peptidyl-prolyl cis-trans isomerase FkpA
LLRNLFLSSCLFLILGGCKTYSDDDKSSFDQKIESYIQKHQLKGYKNSDSGLFYNIIQEGEGDYIKITDEVEFTYVGKLLNGHVFDGKNKRTPVKFKVSALIEGWKETMLYLKKGGKAKIIVPPQLGYGDYDLDAIPPNSILIFTIEVKDVK